MSNDIRDTFITISRDSDGVVQSAELFAGFSFLESEAVLLDIFHVESGANSGRFVGTAEAEEDDVFTVDDKKVTLKGRRPVSELIASWVTNPPVEPTENVAFHIGWERHIQQEIDIMRGK